MPRPTKDNVVEFPMNELMPERPEKTLEKAGAQEFVYLGVIGYQTDGSLYLRFSEPSGPDALWILEQVKRAILSVEGQ